MALICNVLEIQKVDIQDYAIVKMNINTNYTI